jgi:hypothetical protein
LDWPSSGNKAGVEAGYRALIVWAMQDAHQLSLKLGNTSDAQLCLYNPQIEMFARFKMKSSFHKTKRII